MAIKCPFLAVFLAIISLAPAQVDRATLVGIVSDSSGAVIPNAKIEALSQETGLRREVAVQRERQLHFLAIAIKTYTVTATQSGFRSVAIKDVRLGVGDNRAFLPSALGLLIAITAWWIIRTCLTNRAEALALEAQHI